MGLKNRERERCDICYNCELSCWEEQNYYDCKAKETISASIAKENSRLQYYSILFLRENEIRDYFYVISWTNYKFE